MKKILAKTLDDSRKAIIFINFMLANFTSDIKRLNLQTLFFNLYQSYSQVQVNKIIFNPNAVKKQKKFLIIYKGV